MEEQNFAEINDVYYLKLIILYDFKNILFLIFYNKKNLQYKLKIPEQY